MNDSVETIKRLLKVCSKEEKESVKRHLQKVSPHALETLWKTDSDTILGAILRASDITKRGVRGIIAEAVFENKVQPRLERSGWKAHTIIGDLPYDVQLHRDGESARIQIKLQRSEKGAASFYLPGRYVSGFLYKVEVQKTRTGEKNDKKTRPYVFTDFDILAVNMQASSGEWNDFRYTVASWLIPSAKNSEEFATFQPVTAEPGDLWTDDIERCLEWLRSGEKRDMHEAIKVFLKPARLPKTPKRKKSKLG